METNLNIQTTENPTIKISELLQIPRSKYNRASGIETDDECMKYGIPLDARDDEHRSFKRLYKSVTEEGFICNRKIFKLIKVATTGNIYITNGQHMCEVLRKLVSEGRIDPNEKVYYECNTVENETDVQTDVDMQNQEKEFKGRDKVAIVNKDNPVYNTYLREQYNLKHMGTPFLSLYGVITFGQGGLAKCSGPIRSLYKHRHDVFAKYTRFAEITANNLFGNNDKARKRMIKKITRPSHGVSKLIGLFKMVYDYSYDTTGGPDWANDVLEEFIQNGMSKLTSTDFDNMISLNQGQFAEDFKKRFEHNTLKFFKSSRAHKDDQIKLVKIVNRWATK